MLPAANRAYDLAQVNIALPLEPLDAPLLADFVAALEPVNALADRSPGFLWRLQSDEGDATAIRGFGDDHLIVKTTTPLIRRPPRHLGPRDPHPSGAG